MYALFSEWHDACARHLNHYGGLSLDNVTNKSSQDAGEDVEEGEALVQQVVPLDSAANARALLRAFDE
jgi:hypothetical protein